MKLLNLFKSEKRIGSAQGKRRYDLPLDKSDGAGFLVLLIGLMSFLAVMALSASFALSYMTNRWSSGLENQLTIEVPAEKSGGSLRSAPEIKDLQKDILKSLSKLENVKTYTPLQDSDLKELLAPWLGADIELANMPLPGLVSVELSETTPTTIGNLQAQLKKIDADIIVNTHEEWLNDLLRITGGLQFSALLIALVIGITTITATAGAIRSRMAVHRKDVELLHLMGANDYYISRQFQRHALLIALKGSALGTLASFAIMLVIGLFSGDTAQALLPDFQLSAFHTLCLLAMPALACIIAAITARYTVLHELSLMP